MRSCCKKGMTVNLEVFDYDMDKAALIGPAPYAAKFAADMRTTHSNFGLMVDLSHFPTTYETSRFVIQTLRPYINHFHIGNAVVKKAARRMVTNTQGLVFPMELTTRKSYWISLGF